MATEQQIEVAKAERIRSAVGFDSAQAEQIRCAADFNEEDDEEEDDQAAHSEVDKALSAARAFIADPKRFKLLTIYEGRIHRNMTKNLQQLTELQATRHAAEAKQNALREQALDEARLLTQLDSMEGTPCGQALSPDCAGNGRHLWSANGFGFSTVEIARTIRRITRLKDVRHAASANWNPFSRRAA